ncbi:tetratricopeptide repeat protein [uncultured Pseudosulfitobacter sp.]|uniref:tetratricopeptide repeat protein n=1 Tax=uncultured Pseudosulfitobacter sp. TaxID=2854214 RepID=UPI0030DD8429
MIRTLLKSTVATALIWTLTGPLAAQDVAGPYLAARQASYLNDFGTAARYYDMALLHDAENATLMEDATLAHLMLGDVLQALPIALNMEQAGLRSQAAHMAVIADMAQREDYDALLDRDMDTQGIGPLVDGLLVGWAHVGAGDMKAALASFDKVSREQGLKGFALYHKAMALAMSGDYQAAEAIFAGTDSGTMVRTRRGAMARAEVLSQLDRNADAVTSLQEAFGGSLDPELEQVITALEAGETLPFTHVTSARDGLAEVFYSLAGALRSEASADYTLLYGRLARYLRPNHVDALLLNAELLEELDQYDLAIAVYKEVPASDPAFHAAELGRAAALRRADKPDAAIEVLEQLARSYPDLPVVFSTLGDVLRQQDQFAESIAAYDRALELTPEGARAEWFLLYARAISHERLGQWTEAEADFRHALALNPGQPQVLNYLGYSMVEQQVNLDEALSMIEQAVAASPDSGYIIDSLGWVLYRLGRYEEAVVHMERAAQLVPVDAVVNDHLGDTLWAVGRKREARFQWRRALSFVDPKEVNSEADPDRMRRKLEVGLDKVLAEEGAPPLKVAVDR